jgi:hypothetical protein
LCDGIVVKPRWVSGTAPESAGPKEHITVEALLRALSSPPKAQSVTQITYGAAFCSYVPDQNMHSFGRRRGAMTWTSDRTGVLLYAILATLFVMAWIYVPA